MVCINDGLNFVYVKFYYKNFWLKEENNLKLFLCISKKIYVWMFNIEYF